MCDFDCSDDKVGDGVFTDQKWCDFIPCFFNDYKILRDEGLNVASWNLSTRNLRFELDGQIYSNKDTLKFFHFTKVENVGRVMIKKYSATTVPIELMIWYSRELMKIKEKLLPSKWAYSNNVL